MIKTSQVLGAPDPADYEDDDKGQVLFERKGSKARILQADGTYANITIPRDRSMLSLMDAPICDGALVADDGWAYSSDLTKKKKWFDRLDGSYRIWTPRYYNRLANKINYPGIVKIHSVLKKAEAVSKKAWEAVWELAEEIYQTKSHRAHVPTDCLTHVHTDPGETSWWFYRIDKRDDHNEGTKQLSFSFDWVKPPDKPINITRGKKFYKLTQRAEQCSKRRYIAWKFLEAAIEKVLGPPWEVKYRRQNDVYLIEIGGEVFRASLYFHGSGGKTWEIFDRSVEIHNIKIEDKQCQQQPVRSS